MSKEGLIFAIACAVCIFIIEIMTSDSWSRTKLLRYRVRKGLISDIPDNYDPGDGLRHHVMTMQGRNSQIGDRSKVIYALVRIPANYTGLELNLRMTIKTCENSLPKQFTYGIQRKSASGAITIVELVNVEVGEDILSGRYHVIEDSNGEKTSWCNLEGKKIEATICIYDKGRPMNCDEVITFGPCYKPDHWFNKTTEYSNELIENAN